jgi:hypothetical protein
VKRAQLADVKTSLYNPALPTINQMHRDSVLCKLPDEHCRFTSRLNKTDFESKSFYTLKPPLKTLTSLVSTQHCQFSSNKLVLFLQ